MHTLVPMQQYPVIRLKPGREIHLKNRHHAVYRNALEGATDVPTGSIVELRSSDGQFLCHALYNARAYIACRVINFEEGDPLAAMRRHMKQAIDMRKAMLSGEDTTAYRLINAEGDSLPGIILDRYGDTLVLQLTTLGTDRLRDWICRTLLELTGLTHLYEKSTGAARKKEGLEPREGWIGERGEERTIVRERGLHYVITLEDSQKTGLFLDQRAMRSLVRELSPGRTVLDVCSYVGGFSLSALAGGAAAADAVDYDAAALARAEEHMRLNDIAAPFTTYAEDAFDFLRRSPPPQRYDFIILDPPAFAKRSSDIDPAKRAYTDLNRLAMQQLPPGGLLLTCSCSYQMDGTLFQTVVFHAARQANRSVRILQRHRQAMDHPVNIYHPEGDYLKSLLLWVE